MITRSVEYLPVSPTPSNPVVFCLLCGAAVWDTDVHTRWHFPPPQED